MPVIEFGKTLKELRQRKGWQQERLLNTFSDYYPVINRLERGELLPRDDAMYQIMDVLETPIDEIIYPHLGKQSMDAYALRNKLIHALDSKDLLEAQAAYDEISAMLDISDKLNRQFMLMQQARILELQGKPADKIMPLVLSGINETFEDFSENSPGDKVLVFEEPELFHILAKLHARNGNMSAAIKMLEDTKQGLQRLPTGERERDRRIMPIILSLADCQLKVKAYANVLETCETGLYISAMRTNGQGTPELLAYKADALFNMGKRQEVTPLLRMAFAGYLMLGEKEMAIDILAKAGKDYGITFETYGMENLDIPARKLTSYARGKIPSCNTLGDTLNILREEAGLSKSALCKGICSVSNLLKIENDDIKGHIHYVEPMMQRLGRDPMLYFNFFLLRKDFEARELKDLINLLLIHRKRDQASAALEKLKTYKAYTSGVNLQFVLRVEAALFATSQGATHPKVEDMLLEALHTTCPKFNEKDIIDYPLTHDESVIINMLAGFHMENKDLRRAAKIYEALLDNLNRRYVDEQEKSRMYPAVMFNYSTCLGRLDRRLEALEIVAEAEEFSRNRGRLDSLPTLISNKAYNLYMRGGKDKSLPYFALSYYGYAIFEDYGRAVNMSIKQDQAMRFFGIKFD